MTDATSASAKNAGSDGWSRSEHLLALVVDELRIANWQRTKDGSKGRKKPKPISPLSAGEGTLKYGKTDKSPEEVIAYFDRIHKRGKWAEPVEDPGELELANGD